MVKLYGDFAMPIYEYKCDSCGHELEVIQKLSEPVLTTCPSCGEAALKKLVSAAGFQLKGSGWYATDSKRSADKKKDKGDADAAADTGSGASKKAGGCGSGSCGCAH
ncbi:MAG: hypothetical protein BMS9Abin22_626 [Gammaproteobacteria bacterium]|nr:MAG: hypothetical protein BMS9Abin22_626 [Gammaproteobacteria bacterium]